jgi:hypothetical protein
MASVRRIIGTSIAAGGYGRKVATARARRDSGCVTPDTTPEAGFKTD